MKKLTAWLMILSLGLFTIGCGEEGAEVETETETPAVEAPEGEPVEPAGEAETALPEAETEAPAE